MHSHIKPIITLLLLALLAGCGAENAQPDELTGQTDDGAPMLRDLAFTLNVTEIAAAGLNASRIDVQVSGNLTERTLSVPVTSDSVSVSFVALPVGIYSIQVGIYDGENLIAEGSGSAQVYQNSQSSVNILMNPVSGNLEVGICIPGIGMQYLNASMEGVLVNNPQTQLTGLNQPAPQRYSDAIAGVSDAVIEYRIGNAEIPATGISLTMMASYIDHGASFRLSAEGTELFALSGCNTRVAISRTTDTLSIFFLMPEAYEVSIPVILTNVNLGSIEMNGLTMMIQLVDTNGDTGLANATHLADLDFSKFENQTVYLGVPYVTGLSGLPGTLLNNHSALVDHGFYLSRQN